MGKGEKVCEHWKRVFIFVNEGFWQQSHNKSSQKQRILTQWVLELRKQ